MTLQACGLRGAHDLESLGLRAAVAMDSDVSDIIRARYLDPLSGDSARELIATLRAYLACDMHVERTATRLFVHQNTVRYRIARFEELTGANLRETRVVVEVWWALALSEMSL
ncbi:PucR family transcriptional regulator [Nocardiaceae bacterium YC2-7]|uniref:PucR family transcriptional regulator n=2 Tax=Antrihabitans stalactiti TaxID=2584121 RepID=A0A848K5V7_9NOCA|nr:PucR family transcriptional regulator [Antrihabitans stalactiti]